MRDGLVSIVVAPGFSCFSFNAAVAWQGVSEIPKPCYNPFNYWLNFLVLVASEIFGTKAMSIINFYADQNAF